MIYKCTWPRFIIAVIIDEGGPFEERGRGREREMEKKTS